MSPRAKLAPDAPRPCGHPREPGTTKCRVCDKLAARRRKATRLARVKAMPPVPARHGRPVISAKVAALIEECRPAYLRAIAPTTTRRAR